MPRPQPKKPKPSPAKPKKTRKERIQSAKKAGRKGAKALARMYGGLASVRAGSIAGTVTALRYGSEWRSNLQKSTWAKRTPAERKRIMKKTRAGKKKKA